MVLKNKPTIEIEILTKAAIKGLTVSEAAKETGIKKARVYYLSRRYKIKFKRSPRNKEFIEKIKEAAKKGLNRAQTAELLCTSKQNIAEYANRHDIQFRIKARKRSDLKNSGRFSNLLSPQAYKEAAEAGMTFKQASKYLEVTEVTVRRNAKLYGINFKKTKHQKTMKVAVYEYIKAANENLDISQTAKKLGVTTATVKAVARKNKIRFIP